MKPNLQGIEDTLYIPLLGRIYVSKNFPELLYDKKALELEKHIPVNKINQNNNEYIYIAGANRYYVLDKEVRQFIGKHTNANIVNLGAGLETMYQRINNKDAQFYELDLPEIIKLRQQFLPEQSNDKHIASSFMDVSWTKQIDASKPTLIVASGLFYYFKPEQVIKFLQDVRQGFKHLEIVFDVNSKTGMRISNRIVEKSGNQNAKMYFYIQNVQRFCKSISPEITTAISYPYYKNTHQILKGKIKFSTKMTMKISDYLDMVKIVKIRLC